VNVLVLGDSLAISPTPSQNFAVELQRRLRTLNPAWTVINAGVRGDTTGGGLSRCDYWLGGHPQILVLALGANDGLRGVNAASVEKNLATIIERAQARGTRVLLCGMQAPPLWGWDHARAFQEVFPRLAARYQVALVPFLLEGVMLNRAMNGPDGIHPNAAGARAIADLVWRYLEPLLAAATTRSGHAR
jgi:acyl-CoA thioesterase-1